MRIRTIKPEFWQNQQLANLPAETRLLAIGLLNYADDEGFFVALPALIRAAVFPFMEDSRSVHGMLRELSQLGYIELGKDDSGKICGKVVNFKKHQVINRPQASKIKGFVADSLNNHGVITEQSRSAHCRNGMEMEEEQGKGREWIPPKPPVGDSTAESFQLVADGGKFVRPPADAGGWTREDVLSWWNGLAKGKPFVPAITSLNDQRWEKWKARRKEGLDPSKVKTALDNAEAILYDGHWFSFDWLCKSETNAAKLQDGNYSTREKYNPAFDEEKPW